MDIVEWLEQVQAKYEAAWTNASGARYAEAAEEIKKLRGIWAEVDARDAEFARLQAENAGLKAYIRQNVNISIAEKIIAALAPPQRE